MSFKKDRFLDTSRVTIIVVSVAILLALLAFAGWIFNIEFLRSFNPQWQTIKVNTIFGILFSGISLYLFIKKKDFGALFLGAIVFLLGIITFGEHIFHFDAHIDELFFVDRGTSIENNHGRMAQLTSIAFSVIGLSLLTYSSKRKWVQNFSQIAAILVLIMSFAGFIGAFYNAGISFKTANIASFSIPSAVAGFMMSIGILFSRPEGFVSVFLKQTASSKAIIKGIFISIALLILMGWLCLKGERNGLFDHEMGLVIMITIFTISFFFIALSGIQRLNKSENLLTASEKNLRHVLSSTADVFYVIDRNYIITLINEMAKKNLTRAWGKPVKQGANIFELIPNEKNEPIHQSFEKTFAGEKIEYELHQTEMPDLPEWVLVSYKPVIDNDGTVIGAYIVTKDITLSKKAEEELKQSNNRFELISRTTNDAIWEWDLETGQLWSNEMHQQLYGLSMTDPVPGENMWAERIHPDDRETILNKQEASLNTDTNVFICEYHFNVEGKGYRNIYDRCYIVRNQDGKAIRMMGSMVDVTEQKRAEEELRKSEQRYRSLIEQASDYIMITDSKGNFIDVNSSLCKMFGYTREELLSKNISQIVDPIQLKNDPIRFDILLQGQSMLRERRMMNKDGTIIEVEANVKMLPDGRILAIARNIEERKKAEEELKRSEERYRSLVENATEALVVFDAGEKKFVSVSESAAKLFKMSKEELLKIGPVDVSPEYQPDGRLSSEMAMEKISETISGQKPSFEWMHCDKEGALIPCEIWLVRLPAENQILIRGTIINISERKKAEQAIRASEETRRLIMDSSLDAIVCMDIKGAITVWTPQAEKIFGWKEEEVIGLKLSDTIVPSSFREKHVKGLQLYRETGKGPILNKISELKAMRKDGSEFPVELSIIPFLQDGNEFFCGFIRDITERKKAAELILRERDLSDTIINSMPGIFYLFNEDGKYLRWNKLKEVITGYSYEEIQKMSPLDFFEGSDKDYVRKHIEEGLKTGETNVEASIVTKDRKRIPFFFTGIALQYEGRRCLLGTGINISDRKKAEEEVQRSYIAIRQLTEHLQNIREEERTHIAREIHDELGQQLTVLKMDASWLNKKLSSSDESVKQKLKDLLELLDGTVRTVRKISSELRPSLLDDMGLVAAMEWHLKEFEKRAAVQTKFLMPQHDLHLNEATKTGLFRIFQESLTNVARHAGAKKVEVKLQQQNGNVILSIKDDGKGFDKEKAANKKTLGILGMEERSFMMGGSYEINSKPGQGTLVIVSVPGANN